MYYVISASVEQLFSKTLIPGKIPGTDWIFSIVAEWLLETLFKSGLCRACFPGNLEKVFAVIIFQNVSHVGLECIRKNQAPVKVRRIKTNNS